MRCGLSKRLPNLTKSNLKGKVNVYIAFLFSYFVLLFDKTIESIWPDVKQDLLSKLIGLTLYLNCASRDKIISLQTRL